MLLKKITTLTIIATSLISGSAIALSGACAIAQEVERFVTVGATKDGDPLMLDTQDIRGTRFKLIRPYGSGIAETTLKASCGESRLFITKVAVINSSGQTVMEDKTSEEMTFNAESATGKAMTFVCRKMGARGW